MTTFFRSQGWSLTRDSTVIKQHVNHIARTMSESFYPAVLYPFSQFNSKMITASSEMESTKVGILFSVFQHLLDGHNNVQQVTESTQNTGQHRPNVHVHKDMQSALKLLHISGKL